MVADPGLDDADAEGAVGADVEAVPGPEDANAKVEAEPGPEDAAGAEGAVGADADVVAEPGPEDANAEGAVGTDAEMVAESEPENANAEGAEGTDVEAAPGPEAVADAGAGTNVGASRRSDPEEVGTAMGAEEEPEHCGRTRPASTRGTADPW